MSVLRILMILMIFALLSGCMSSPGGKRTHVMVPTGSENELMVGDFSQAFSLDPPPPGWYHRIFMFSPPMELTLAVKDGLPALRVATDDSGSMLFRYVDIPVDDFPLLSWQWLIEQPIESEADETTWKGDDSPARLFLNFETEQGQSRSMEIIWGNRLQAGDVKFMWKFPHYVARGGNENVGRWFEEEVDLRKVFNRFWPEEKPQRLLAIAIFCDSDNSAGTTVSYFGRISLKKSTVD